MTKWGLSHGALRRTSDRRRNWVQKGLDLATSHGQEEGLELWRPKEVGLRKWPWNSRDLESTVLMVEPEDMGNVELDSSSSSVFLVGRMLRRL